MPADQSPRQRSYLPSSDFDIRIARDGTWYHQGAPIARKPLVKLFASVLRRDEDGAFWLQTPVEKGRVEVEDAPFTAVELCVKGQGREQILSFRSNLDDWVEADSDHPLRVVENPENHEVSPYILIRDRLDALILRPVYYELASLAVAPPENSAAPAGCLGVWSKGVFFPLGAAT